jgi:hypothetical protein
MFYYDKIKESTTLEEALEYLNGVHSGFKPYLDHPTVNYGDLVQVKDTPGIYKVVMVLHTSKNDPEPAFVWLDKLNGNNPYVKDIEVISKGLM